MRPERCNNVVGGQVARRRLVGIDPDAHGVVAHRAAANIADAVDAQQPVADVQSDIVGNVLLVEGAVR